MEKLLKRSKIANLAIYAYSRCIDLKPWSYEFFFARAENYSNVGKLEKAERDFTICSVLKPNRFEPFLELINNVFRYNLRGNYNKLHLLANTFQYKSSEKIDIFERENEKLREKCMREFFSLEQGTKKWDERKAKFFVYSLQSNQTSLYEMAKNGLSEMYLSLKLHQFIKTACQNKRLFPRARARLNEIQKKLWHKYLTEEKIKMRYNLICYYSGCDRKTLIRIYHEHKLEVLSELIKDEKENSIIRFLAGQVLFDMRSISSSAKLKNLACSSQVNISTRIIANTVLASKGGKIFPGIFEEVEKLKFPYILAKAIAHIPFDQELLCRLLHHKNIYVRLYAANKLRWKFPEKAEKVFKRGFLHENPYIRIFAISSCWNLNSFLNRKEFVKRRDRCIQLEHYLITLAKDPHPQVKRIVLISMANMRLSKYLKIIKEHIRSKNLQTRYQALTAVGIMRNMKLLTKIALNPKEAPTIRVAAFLSAARVYNVRKGQSNGKEGPENHDV